ncbi:agmatine/peptidylarginine deiminase [uncultured Acinetobacter sp.]|uniref:agmatine deiminase family protein n=1 Tax=uncultured Acinetobacter sp. TaxID=165433 RepID=UPI0025FEF89E|nr:agmatine deiminase family protein [uncultured Acinetobacter sp.]
MINVSRRKFLGLSAAVGALILTGCGGSDGDDNSSSEGSTGGNNGTGTNTKIIGTMPDEAEPHTRTWMVFGASDQIHEPKNIDGLRNDLARIALSIAAFEPVSVLVRAEEMDIARAKMKHSNITLVTGTMDDFWARDTGPVFVKDAQNKLTGIDFNFNGWGKKQSHNNDKTVATQILSNVNIERVTSSLTLEGGGIEVDGLGTAIITESCVLNDNRNPGVTKAACEAELKRCLGISKVIWLPGIKDKDITDGHTDFYARFVSEGVVVAAYDSDPQSYDHAVTKQHLEILKTATDAKGNKLKVIELQAPTTLRVENPSEDFAAGYINYYVCNKAVIMPEFGDSVADAEAKQKLQTLFPNRSIVQINIDYIAAGGGGIHCTTQQQPM